MFAGVGDDPAPTIATAMAETSKTDATQKATDTQLQNAMQAGKQNQGVITPTDLTVQKAAGFLMSGWGLASMALVYWVWFKK